MPQNKRKERKKKKIQKARKPQDFDSQENILPNCFNSLKSYARKEFDHYSPS